MQCITTWNCSETGDRGPVLWWDGQKEVLLGYDISVWNVAGGWVCATPGEWKKRDVRCESGAVVAESLAQFGKEEVEREGACGLRANGHTKDIWSIVKDLAFQC